MVMCMDVAVSHDNKMSLVIKSSLTGGDKTEMWLIDTALHEREMDNINQGEQTELPREEEQWCACAEE